ncbi:hypothetical protein DPX16_12072 [Anabarilius grahami]|uniref:Uncharacterized protein n=1 Tax=Anabarilius grahami TaxID=495550 RepID=A0A3N0YYW9_ANAGA|nr:hypothetical protein DPX16_12072 [Anabarilius grahami]
MNGLSSSLEPQFFGVQRQDPEDLVRDRGYIQPVHRPQRHHQTGLEGDYYLVSGERHVLIRNTARPRASSTTDDR